MPTTISINIGDVDTNRVLDAIATNYKYQDTVLNPAFDDQLPVDPETNPETIDNPETKGAFAKGQIITFLKENVKSHESRVASRAAIDAVDGNVDVT